MSHSHSHHNHHTVDFKRINTAFALGIGLNTLYTIVEFIIGYRTGSLALIADASHNLSDVASLIISLIGMRLAQRAATYAYTYGYKKASILASLINSILLIVIVINIFREGVERLSHPQAVNGTAIVITALIGVVINTLSAFLFFKGQKKDINIRGAFLHLLVDALVSVSVVISGFAIRLTGLPIIDPLISFAIGAVIVISTWGLLRESLKLILNGVPKNVSIDRVKQLLAEHPLISEAHHIHIWALSTSTNALTAHITLRKEVTAEEFVQLKTELRKRLLEENIHHVTLEPDPVPGCSDHSC